ncbi:MAG: VWA domain-containing protein [Planctomycetaceae bacterium]|jgi:uncharacterized protein YegL|nr:VWA domain-containing protein [Planctomycetaceae bacterium]
MRRLPIYILIDCSASMFGEPIEAVKDGIQKLLSSLRRDPYALESVWISVMTFDSNANVLIPLTELPDFHCPEIKLSNSTIRNLGLGLQLLLNRYQKEIKSTTTDEKGDWLPIVVLMTNGDPSDTKRFETIISQFNTFPFAKIILCVTGIKSEISALKRITKDIFMLDTMDSHAFSRFWQWVSTVASLSLFNNHNELILPSPQENNADKKQSKFIEEITTLLSKSFHFPIKISCLIIVFALVMLLLGTMFLYRQLHQTNIAKITSKVTTEQPNSISNNEPNGNNVAQNLPDSVESPSVSISSDKPTENIVLEKPSESIQLTVTEVYKFTEKKFLYVFLPDSQSILTCDKEKVKIYDAINGKERRSLEGHQDDVRSIVFSHDQKFILSASGDTARIWDINTCKELRQLKHHGNLINIANFSPNGKYIATAGEIGIAWIWNTETGELLHALKGHKKNIQSINFSPDNKLVITASYDDTVRIWNVLSGEEVQELSVFTPPQFAGYSPDGRFFAANSYRNITIWDAVTYKLLHKIESYLGREGTVVFSPDGQFVLTISDNTAQILNIATGKILHKFQHTGNVNSAVFSSDGRFVLTASNNTTARIWDAVTGKELCTFEPAKNIKFDPFSHDKPELKYIQSAIFSPDGRFVMTFISSYVTIWSVTESK